MASQAPVAAVPRAPSPTIWGLSPAQFQDRFWASRGVQVVRRGEQSELIEAAELYLLVDPTTLVVFQLRDLVETLSWLRPKLLIVRLRGRGHDEYREVVNAGPDGEFLDFERIYGGLDSRLARVGLTPHREVARLWQGAESAAEGWTTLRREIPAEDRLARAMPGHVFDATRDDQLMAHMERLMAAWDQPDSTILRAVRGPSGVWADQDSAVSRRAAILGKVWVGAGRKIADEDVVAGPAVLWDDPAHATDSAPVPWLELEPVAEGGGARPVVRRTRLIGKRLFDIVFSLGALALTLPLYPFIALAILVEDGWPIFFAHRRETLRGREFPCLKFRSMRRDAEQIKAKLEAENKSDGPQFFLEKDPRSTRVGSFLRSTQLDEIPQFLNVLVGHMSIVGPRPSPRRENQFCPAWREARLSVRPGITGLWQVRRTRAKGLDFQEWIRFDIEYVERMSWRLDLEIIWKTFRIVLRGLIRRRR